MVKTFAENLIACLQACMVMIDVFEEARRELYFPPVKLRLVDGNRIRLNFAGKRRKPEIEAGREVFFNYPRDALKGLFQLSLARWMKHPYSLKVAMLEEFWLKDYDKRKRIRELYDTIVCSIYLIKRGCMSVFSALYCMNGDDADRAVRLYLGRRFISSAERNGKRDSGGNERDENERVIEAARKMESIEFEVCTNLSILRSNLIRFAEIIEDLIEGVEEETLEFNLSAEGIEELAGEVGLDEFRELSDYFGCGRGKGDERLADIRWYMRRSSKYSIRIEGRAEGGSYPGRLADFSPDDGIDYYSPVESMGKVIPGIAKRYIPEGFEGCSEERKNAVIILDSSGSMKSPESGSEALIGAFAIARKYLGTGGKVGVVNFSWKTELLEPCRGERVFRALARYQGGGTEIDASAVVKYVKEFARGYDIIMITDAGIENVEEVENMLKELKSIGCRNYIIWLSSNAFLEKRERLARHATVYEVGREEDIPKIVLGFGR